MRDINKFSGSESLKKNLISNYYTLVSKERFDTIDIVKKEIYENNIEGDVVECGVWRGGMSIFLSYMFPEKRIWVCDSYDGFQPINESLYTYYGDERHDEFFDEKHPGAIPYGLSIKVTLDEVKKNFDEFGLNNDDKIFFLKGWVKDTLNPKNCKIKKISLLRIDVDSYSATLEVLDLLYDKVSDGGYIIFDDSALHECKDAIKDFQNKRNIKFNFNYPEGLAPNESKNGAYVKK